MTHKTVRNTGQKTKFYVVDHHAPIVSREMWNRVQEKMKEVTRGAPKTTKMSQMKKHSVRIKAFSCLKCGILKKDKITFHRTISRTNRGDSAVYVCCRKKYKERPLKKCENCVGRLPEFTIEQSFMEMLYKCKKEIEFHHMTFGVTLAAYNINRGIRDYIGYRYVKNDGIIGCIRNTQVLYDELLRRNS